MSKHTHMYHNTRWRKLRIAMLAIQPYCLMCASRKPSRVVPATVIDHITPHRGNLDLFWDTNNLQSLCADCHNSDKQRQDNTYNSTDDLTTRINKGFDSQGYLIDDWGDY